MAHGVDERRRIIGTSAPHRVLHNLPLEMIERFRKQLTLVDLQFEGHSGVIAQAVAACYQEEPTAFRDSTLCDPGATDAAAAIRSVNRQKVWAADDGRVPHLMPKARHALRASDATLPEP